MSFKTGELNPHQGSIYTFQASDFQGVKPVFVNRVTFFHEAGFLNGLATLNADRKRLLLAADSLRGVVWRLDLETREKTIVIDDPLMKKKSLIGINGLRVHSDGKLYFTNLDMGIIASVPISSKGEPKGKAKIITRGVTSADDLILLHNRDPKGRPASGYVAGNDEVRMFKGSTIETVSMGHLVNGSTAVRLSPNGFGTPPDVYMSTNGNNEQYSTGHITRPGKIVKVLID